VATRVTVFNIGYCEGGSDHVTPKH